MPRRILPVAALLIVAVLVAAAAHSSPPGTQGSNRNEFGVDPAAGIENIDHMIFVVQENRSYDHYFGTFPRGDGLPIDRHGRFTSCIPDPKSRWCRETRLLG